jgi:hypothetical protein
MKDKQRRLLQWIQNQNCSIVFLQETHFNNESKCFIEKQSDYQCFCTHNKMIKLFSNKISHLNKKVKYLQTQF